MCRFDRLPQIDYSSLFRGPVRVVCMGDWHVSYSIKNEFIRILPKLASNGLTHAAFELLSTDMQPFLDRYFELNRYADKHKYDIAVMDRQLAEYYAGIWGNDADVDEAYELKKMSGKMCEMIRTAVSCGVHPVALEPPVPRMFAQGHGYAFIHSVLEKLPATLQRTFDLYFTKGTCESERMRCSLELRQAAESKARLKPDEADRFLQYLERLRSAVPALDLCGLELPRPPDKAPRRPDQPWVDLTTAWRERTWTMTFAKVLQNPVARIVMFAGSGHFGYQMPTGQAEKQGSLLNENLSAMGCGVLVIGFAGGDYPLEMMRKLTKKFGWPFSASMRCTEAAVKAGISGQRFAFRVQESPSRPSDWIVHLPRTPEVPFGQPD